MSITIPASVLVLTIDYTLEPAEHVVHEGALSDIPLGRIASGESREVNLPVSFVAAGRFDIGAEVRVWDVHGEDGKAGKGKLTVDVSEDA
jgi:hypothetical protein